MPSVNYDPNSWTYGVEHEFGDWDQRKGLPKGMKMDRKDVTIVNSNGIAADPRGKTYCLGGEINTPPTKTVSGQGGHLVRILHMHPHCVVNYRSNLHVHIRVPGLKESLEELKLLQNYIHKELPKVISEVEPIPKPVENGDREEFVGARRRYIRRKASHQTFLTEDRLANQFKATTTEEFYRLEVPQSRDGKPLWHFQPRVCVNLRQLLDTDTIEFRHFPGTLDRERLEACINWCKVFLISAFLRRPLTKVWKGFKQRELLPKFPEYEHKTECRYRMTCHDGSLTKATIQTNVELILAEHKASGVFQDGIFAEAQHCSSVSR